jgi:YidC/Oxa1 family membrane protein insertase
MKFDRETLIGIAICAVILFGWDPFMRAMGWMPAKDAPKTTAVAPTPTAPAAPSLPKAPTPAPAPVAPAPTATTASAAAPVAEYPPLPPRPLLRIGNSEIEVSIDPNTGTAVSFQLKKYLNAARTAPIAINTATGSAGALGLVAKDGSWRTVKVLKCTADNSTAEVIREMVNSAGQHFIICERWQLAASGYVISSSATVTNCGSTPLTVPETLIGSGSLCSAKQLAGDNIRRASHSLDYRTVNGEFVDIAADKKDPDFFAGGEPLVSWASVSNKYFCMILDNSDGKFPLWRGRAFTGSGKDASPNIAVAAINPARVLAPEQSATFNCRLYCGPKILHLLEEFEPSATKVMHLTWGPLNYLARFMLWVLVKLHALTGNYGWSIIILTLLVRILFYPVTARGNASMKKMQAVQPKVKELRDKYKDNPQLMNAKMMELYRAEGVNPFGGCLPILLQIPVFFALYATLEGAVELRQSSFYWCHDLAAADTIAKVNLFLFTLPINPLVLAMTALMVLQQHMTPMSMDPAQKKMMMLMPFIMLFFFYDLPSGLTLYWTVSNIFSIIQLRMQQRSGKNIIAAAGAAKK